MAEHPLARDLEHGLGTEDNPCFRGMHHASAHIAGATLEAARRVWAGRRPARRQHQRRPAPRDARPGERLLHLQRPRRSRSRGCSTNGAERVAYVDIDVHHGDGVEADLLRRPAGAHHQPARDRRRCSSPAPATPTEPAGRTPQGTSVNVALPPGTDDAGWLRAFHAVVPPLLREFAPDVLVSQHGCDSHIEDPLAHLMLSVDGQRAAHARAARSRPRGRRRALGRDRRRRLRVVEVVPRAWTHLLAIVGGRPLDPETATPRSGASTSARALGRIAPHADDRRPRAAVRGLVEGYDPRADRLRTSWIRDGIALATRATATTVPRASGLDPLHVERVHESRAQSTEYGNGLQRHAGTLSTDTAIRIDRLHFPTSHIWPLLSPQRGRLV